MIVSKELALAQLETRKTINKPKVIDNASLPAGSPMYYYCRSCLALVATKPESWYRNPPPKYCKECIPLKEAGYIP